MDIKNSKEIIKNVLERYNFSTVYSDTGESYGIETSKNYVDSTEALNFLYSSSVVGSKSLGIFKELPFFEITVPLRAECLFITHKLPRHISTPLFIVRHSDDLSQKLVLALKLSLENKIPVTVVISHNALNNYSDIEQTDSDLGRISPFISGETFKQSINIDSLRSVYESMDNTLKEMYSAQGSSLSIENSNMFFPDYLIPGILPSSIDNIKNEQITTTVEEEKSIRDFFIENYNISLSFNIEEKMELPDVPDLLCPGCPFVNIFIKGMSEDTVVFTDVMCKGIMKAFPNINYMTIDGYMGVISNEVKSKTLFIGRASSYKNHYHQFLSKRGRIILLNDCDIQKIDGLSKIRHPKKMCKEKNILYPYSCNNIKKYGRIKVKLNKCSCMKNNKGCGVFERTLCPAIYKQSDTTYVDQKLCTGCLACKAVCDSGAVS